RSKRKSLKKRHVAKPNQTSSINHSKNASNQKHAVQISPFHKRHRINNKILRIKPNEERESPKTKTARKKIYKREVGNWVSTIKTRVLHARHLTHQRTSSQKQHSLKKSMNNYMN